MIDGLATLVVICLVIMGLLFTVAPMRPGYVI